MSHRSRDPAAPPARDENAAAGAIIWELDPRARRFTYVSGRAETLLGYPLRAWLAEPDFLRRILHPDDRDRALALCREVEQRPAAREVEYRLIAANGRVIWMRDHITGVAGPDGRARLLQGIMVEIAGRAAATNGAAPSLDTLADAAARTAAAESAVALREALFQSCRELLPHATLHVDFGDDEHGAEQRDGTMCALLIHGATVLGRLRLDPRPGATLQRGDRAVLDVLARLAGLSLVNLRGSSEAARTEQVLRDTEALAALLREVTTAAIEARTFNEAAARCLAAISAHAGWPTAHVFVRTEQGDLVSTGAWELTAQTRYREITSVAARIRYRPGIGIVGRVLETGEAVWVRDVNDEPSLRRAGAADVRGAFAFPVHVQGTVAAVLEFLSREPVEPDPAFLDLSRRIAAQLARVIERERAAERIHFQARMLDAVGQAVIASDARHQIVYWNRAAEALFGWSSADVVGRNISEVLPVRATPQQTAEITARLAAGQAWGGEFEVRRMDGAPVPVHITGSVLYDNTGSPSGYVGVATDLRASKDLERRLRQAQRLEAVGRLAGGVAHDFNNLLTSIKGVTLLLLEDLPSDSPLRTDLEEIRAAADRAAGLTAQLLAFSSRQVMRPRVIDLNTVVNDTLPIVRRLIGEDVDLDTDLAAELPPVRVDPRQIGQVIINLAANARDAIAGSGGSVRLRTTIADSAELPAGLRADGADATYILLEVRDNGSGIPPSQLEHIFEPFFTTRDVPGLGLGLSTVYGIVKQSDGHITVESQLGSGTTFRIYLPCARADVEASAEPVSPHATGGSETLLLVEDEDSVRRLAAKILAREGYTVLEASNGLEALEVASRHTSRIDLVVSDVVMPLMSGAELIDRLHVVRPGVPVLLMSGYTGDALSRLNLDQQAERFLEKPFTPAALATKVRALLDEARREADA
jgi:PAS domain S-box-containing protein